MCHRQQTKEQFQVGDLMDPDDLDLSANSGSFL